MNDTSNEQEVLSSQDKTQEPETPAIEPEAERVSRETTPPPLPPRPREQPAELGDTPPQTPSPLRISRTAERPKYQGRATTALSLADSGEIGRAHV